MFIAGCLCLCACEVHIHQVSAYDSTIAGMRMLDMHAGVCMLGMLAGLCLLLDVCTCDVSYAPGIYI